MHIVIVWEQGDDDDVQDEQEAEEEEEGAARNTTVDTIGQKIKRKRSSANVDTEVDAAFTSVLAFVSSPSSLLFVPTPVPFPR